MNNKSSMFVDKSTLVLNISSNIVSDHYPFATFCNQKIKKQPGELTPEELQPLLKEYGKLITTFSNSMLRSITSKPGGNKQPDS